MVALLRDGGYAEYAVAPAERHLRRSPTGCPTDAALALLIQGLTAWHLYRTAARLAEGESVVVHSAAGGVGSLAVQLGKPMGAGRVIATAGSEEQRERALELGADAAVDPDADDLTAALIEANGGEPVDVVLEMAGGAGVRAEPRRRWRRSAGSWPTASPAASRIRCRDAALLRDQPRGGRLLADAPASAGRRCWPSRWPTCSSAPRAAS